jgi:hypothetical protein
VHAPDQESIEHATAGFQRKYAASPEVEAMVRADVLETTIRLEPR